MPAELPVKLVWVSEHKIFVCFDKYLEYETWAALTRECFSLNTRRYWRGWRRCKEQTSLWENSCWKEVILVEQVGNCGAICSASNASSAVLYRLLSKCAKVWNCYIQWINFRFVFGIVRLCIPFFRERWCYFDLVTSDTRALVWELKDPSQLKPRHLAFLFISCGVSWTQSHWDV